MFEVLLGEVPDPTSANVERLGNEVRVHLVVNSSITYPFGIVLPKLHFAGSIFGQTMATKYFADNPIIHAFQGKEKY